MSRTNHKPSLLVFQILVKLFSLITITHSFQNPYQIRKCAELYSQDGFGGLKLEMKDQDHSLNLADNHQVSNGWNTTGSIKIESGCSMSLCNDTYFEGECKPLTAGSHGSSQLSKALGFAIVSAQCTCERECKCSDIFVKKASCARAYLKGGCRTCNSDYADLRNASEVFQEEFVGKIEAFRLRKGCKLKLYSETHFEDQIAVITNETVEDFKGDFNSFQCECNNREYVPQVRPPRPSHFPPLVTIPNTVKEIYSMLNDPNYKQHIGLKSAIKSRSKGRSLKNAYILLLGTTGSGKSSAINLLFDNPTITKTGDYVSTTTDILEFRVKMPIDELGLENTELRVIDTPGLGDTRGVQHDAKFLATLDSYLSTHEELKDRKPNAVLVFHNFNDNRFAGEGSRYVKMMRGFDSFRERLTDSTYSNVIHVLTFYSGADKQVRRRPTERINTFRKVIQEYTTLPRPTIITLAENKGSENSLPMVNGYYRLDNNDYYPRNLFEQLEVITKNGEDPIGLGVFRAAFRDPQDFKVSNSTFKLTDNDGDKVQHYLRIVSNAYLDIKKTEVSQYLERIWEDEVPGELKKKYTNSLQYLQNALHMRHITTKEDVPKTTTNILKLLTALKHDPVTRMLLDKAFGIKPPIFPQNPIAGHCYNIFTDAPLPETPFDGGELQQSDIGFMIPSYLTCKLEQSSAQNFIFVDDQQSYIRERLRSIGIEGQISPALFKGTPKPGYNIKSIAFRNGSSSISARRAFKRFQFVVNERPKLKQTFVDAVKALPTFSENDHVAVTKWNDFFKMYGTHVVRSIHGGGAIEIQLRNKGPVNKEIGKALFSLINFAEDLAFFVGDNETSKDGKRTVLQEGVDHTLVFSGGNNQYHTSDFTKLSIEDAVEMMTNWQQSLKFNPALLTTEMELIPISRVAKKIETRYEEEIERVATIIYNATLKYVPKVNPDQRRIPVADKLEVVVTPGQKPPRPPPPPPREDTKFMTQFFLEMQKSNQRLHETMMSLKKTEMENTRRRDKLEEDRLQWEKEKALMDAARIKEESELRNIDERRREARAEAIRLAQVRQAETDAEKQRQWMGALMAQQNAESARSHDLMTAIIMRPQPRGSCLKAGTKILMADGTEKPVELLEAGDIVVDKDLMATSVLGVAHELLLGQKFYGFDNNSFFFTNSHLFVGPKVANSDSENFTLFAKSTEYLYYNNPLLRYVNVQAMPNNESFELFHVENLSNTKIVSEKIVTVTEDSEVYPLDTPIYFLQVNSSTGTYVANGYVCRHETPDFTRWPNTMSILFRLIETNAFEKISLFPYNIETEVYLKNSINGTVKKVEMFFENYDWSNSGEGSNYEVMTLGDVDLDECILRIYNSPTLSSAGIGFYAGVGPVIAMHLDEDAEHKVNSALVSKIQHELYQILLQEIESYSNFSE
ncbi:unnamed protein product [Orchesella dallaii]|uniref:MACPF domain-containing protein n=1 Tax=Orchesella dallaii TaxID=48710 RepID=A0ABP1PI38_9HEXA